MPSIGALFKNVRAGQSKLAWNLPALSTVEDLALTSSDFQHESAIPKAHVAKRIGGTNQSPSLAWDTPPEGTSQLLLVIEDADVPLPFPLPHVAALLDPTLTSLPTGALNGHSAARGVQLIKVLLGTGYDGPAPIKGHGPHRYVFQLFALADPIPESARKSLKSTLKSPTRALARGRLDGFVQRS